MAYTVFTNKTSVIVSRHAAAVDFIRREMSLDESVPVITGNATPSDVEGKVVFGNVPMHLACMATMVVAIEFPSAPPRGNEYTIEDMDKAGARLVGYKVQRTGE
jgi:hypothetical protein